MKKRNLKPLKNFLIGDDDPDDQELFLEALKEIDEDFVCVTAFDGQEVLDKLENSLFVPDMIFLDLNMPKMNGHECLKEIKKNSLLKKYWSIPARQVETSVVLASSNWKS